MKLFEVTCYMMILLGLMACAGSQEGVTHIYQESRDGQSGYEIIIRQAEKPTVTSIRPLDKSLLLRSTRQELMEQNQKEASKEEPITKEESAPTNLRRKRLQLRRNRYLLLQDG